MRMRWWWMLSGASLGAGAVALGCLGEDVAVGGGETASDGGVQAEASAEEAGSVTDASTSDASLPSFSLAPARPRVARGSVDTKAKLTLDRRGFSSAVTVAFEGLPPGVTALTAPIESTAAETTIGFTASADAGVGVFPFRITAPSIAPFSAAVVVPGNPSGYDTSFDNDGLLLDAANTLYLAALSLPDGAVVVAGATALAGGTWVLKRFSESGQVDASFNAKAAAKLPTTGIPRAIVRDASSGQLYVIGSSTPSQGVERLTILRLNPDGAMDDTYGSAGVVTPTTVVHPQGSQGWAGVLLPDGKLVVAGKKGTLGMVERYTTAGLRDDGFAAFTTAGAGDFTGLALLPASATLAGGRLVAAGTDTSASPRRQSVVRLSIDGSLDATFGAGGARTFASGCTVAGLGIAANGDGVLVGSDQTSPSMCTTRFEASGAGAGSGSLRWTQLTSAGSSGTFVAAAPSFAGQATYAAGEAGGSQDRFAILERRLEDGTLDSAFGSGGALRLEDPEVPDGYRFFIRALAPAPDGRLYVAGSRTAGGVSYGFLIRVWQ